jgi:hypothetical protein
LRILAFLSAANTREFLIATSSGQIHELFIEEKDKREKHVKLLYELQESQEPICAIQVSPPVFVCVSSRVHGYLASFRCTSFLWDGELLFREKDKRVKHVKRLYELQESQEPICAVQVIQKASSCPLGQANIL